MKTVNDGKSVNPFFGSWFAMEGKSETGYFLGCEAIKELEKEYDLQEIALLEDVDTCFKSILERMKKTD